MKRGPSTHGDRKGSFRRRSIRLAQKAPDQKAASATADAVTTRTESMRRKHRNSEGESCKYFYLYIH